MDNAATDYAERLAFRIIEMIIEDHGVDEDGIVRLDGGEMFAALSFALARVTSASIDRRDADARRQIAIQMGRDLEETLARHWAEMSLPQTPRHTH